VNDLDDPWGFEAHHYIIAYLKRRTKLNIRAVDVHKDGQHGLGRTGIVDHLQEKE
jgi:hypothetical protein